MDAELEKKLSKLATNEELKKTNKKIDNVEKNLSKKIDANSKRLDRVTFQVIENKEAIDRMVTKNEFNEFKDEVLSGQDKMMTILTKLDQERMFTHEWIKRVELEGKENKQDIKVIKQKLAIS